MKLCRRESHFGLGLGLGLEFELDDGSAELSWLGPGDSFIHTMNDVDQN